MMLAMRVMMVRGDDEEEDDDGSHDAHGAGFGSVDADEGDHDDANDVDDDNALSVFMMMSVLMIMALDALGDDSGGNDDRDGDVGDV